MVPLENMKFSGSGTEKIACPLCGGNSFKELLIEQDIPVVRCTGCALVMANPRPDRQSLRRFYDEYFPPESAPLWQKQMAGIFIKEGLERIKFFRRKGILQFSQALTVLDIGCGMGFFLDLMREQGWFTRGIEPSKEAAKHARDVLKLDVFEGVIEEFPVRDRYDVITLWYVLEHVPNPQDILRKAQQLLKPGGLIIIRIPNANAPIDQWLDRLGLQKFFLMNPPRHLFDYSPVTIRRFLEKNNFEVLTIRNGIPRLTGTALELIRRFLWFWMFESIYHLSFGRIIRGSSITIYARKKID